MRRFSESSTILGGLALLATLALSSPGVRVVRAADDAAYDAGEGAVCEAGSIRGASEVTAYLREMQRLQEQRDEVAARSDDGTIVLNNRGYNYGTPGFAFPAAREFEAR